MPVALFSKNESQSTMSIDCSKSNSTSVAINVKIIVQNKIPSTAHPITSYMVYVHIAYMYIYT